MLTADPALLAQVVGFGLFFWLGLYMLVRTARRTLLTYISAVGLFAQAAFFFSSAFTYHITDPALVRVFERGFWWTAVLPPAIWFHVSDLMARRLLHPDDERAQPAFAPLVLVSYTAAAFIMLFGTISDLFLNYSETPELAYVSSGPAFPVYMLYMTLAAVGALINFIRAMRSITPNESEQAQIAAQQLRLLALGATFFLAGALWIAVRQNWNLTTLTVLPAYLCVFLGLAGLGYGIASFGMLLDGQNIQRDFIYTLTGVGLLNIVYVGFLLLAGLESISALLALVALICLTHTAFDAGRSVLDRFFFSSAEQTARAEARDYATSLGTAPVTTASGATLPPDAGAYEAARAPEDEPAPAAAHDDPVAIEELDEHAQKEFRNLVRKAITGLKSPPQLAKSPLLSLRLVEQRVEAGGQDDNRLNRASALREILIEQIEALGPGDDSAARVGEAWRFYNVLYYPYVRELSRKGALAEARRLAQERRRQGQAEPSELEQVLTWLADVDEDTFYKWQRRASDTIASILWEENAKLKGLAAR